MKQLLKKMWQQLILLAAVLVLFTAPAWGAADYYLYDNQDQGDVFTTDVPPSESYFFAMCYIPDTAAQSLRGRLIGASGKNIYMQNAVDSSEWTLVGTVTVDMDPSFIRVSPDGTKVALGLGFQQDLLVFPLESLTSGQTPNLDEDDATMSFSSSFVIYYDAAWVDNDHLVINGGEFDAATQQASSVGIICVDVSRPISTDNRPVTIISRDSYPGASSGIAVDADKNLIFGNGASSSSESKTGELVMLKADQWWNSDSGAPLVDTPIDYAEAQPFAEAVLSAAYLGFDSEGNLHVGGGQFLPEPGSELQNGYAVLINKKVIQDAANPDVEPYEIDKTDPTQYREFAPDTCRNDSATGVLTYGHSISVNWIDGSGACTPGGSTDWYSAGVPTKLTTYRVNADLDSDGDSYADVDDNSPWTYSTDNTDTDGDGYGNIIDGDFNNDGVVNRRDSSTFSSAYRYQDNDNCDLNGDGIINRRDKSMFNMLYRYTNQAPFYNADF